MLCLDSEVYTALSTNTALINLLGGSNIYQPNQTINTTEPFKAVVFEEISNVPAISADNQEKESRITYRLLVYNSESLVPIMNAVEQIMIGINFVRHSSQNLHDLPPEMRGKEIYFITIRENF